MEQTAKRGRGRPPKYGEAMSGADRQFFYAQARQREMVLVAYALKDALAAKPARKAFVSAYRGTSDGVLLQRALTRLLVDDPEAMAFFDQLISRC